MRRLMVTTALALCASASLDAHAFVRTRTKNSGTPIAWGRRCLPFHVHEGAFTQNIPLESVIRAARQSFEAWQRPTCSDLELAYQGITNDDRTGYRQTQPNINVVAWRQTEAEWEETENPKTALAVTTVTFCEDTRPAGCDAIGRILDADMEVNGGGFTFTVTQVPTQIRFDLRNTLTHEVGHVLGFDHSRVAAATMFASAPAGETSKATLHEDDIDALCTAYPASENPAPCEPFDPAGDYIAAPEDLVDEETGGGGSQDEGCQTAGGPAGAGALALLVALGGLRLRRRRGRLG